MFWRKALTYWHSVLVIGAIAYGCLLRKPLYQLPPIEDGDKWVHWLAFAVLTLVMLWDSKKAGLRPWQMWIVGLVFPMAYGGLIEILQERFFYPRTGEWGDWFADGIGVLVGAAVWWISQKWYARRVAQ
jgi:VanZ family protein